MILKVENGSFAYKNGPQILEDINFEVQSGEILAVLGPNGAGKTTLLRCVMDMLRWKTGSSSIDGEDIRKMTAKKLWSRMAYVPQAKSAATSFTAFQTVLLGRSSRIGSFSSPKKSDLEAAERVMRKLGIFELADKPCHEISGGEFQMVLIARALAAEPEILVLDEPESNLDFRNQLIVLDTISDLAKQGMACIFNTHYPAHALQRADKAVIISKDGRDGHGAEGFGDMAGAGDTGARQGGTCIYGATSEVVTEENIRKAFGVNAMIGEIDTPDGAVKTVMPLSISGDDSI